MPTVAIVDGVRIIFYANEHWPAHFHARLAEHQAVFSIGPVRLVRGSLPQAKQRRIVQWAQTREAELIRAFGQAIGKRPVDPIE
jgi:hypothetical protein